MVGIRLDRPRLVRTLLEEPILMPAVEQIHPERPATPEIPLNRCEARPNFLRCDEEPNVRVPRFTHELPDEAVPFLLVSLLERRAELANRAVLVPKEIRAL